jgi:hypothetical protein
MCDSVVNAITVPTTLSPVISQGIVASSIYLQQTHLISVIDGQSGVQTVIKDNKFLKISTVGSIIHYQTALGVT